MSTRLLAVWCLQLARVAAFIQWFLSHDFETFSREPKKIKIFAEKSESCHDMFGGRYWKLRGPPVIP